MEFIFKNIDSILVYACIVIHIIAIIEFVLITFINSYDGNFVERSFSVYKLASLISIIGALVLWLFNRKAVLIEKSALIGFLIWSALAVIILLINTFKAIFHKNSNHYPIKTCLKNILFIGILLLFITTK